MADSLLQRQSYGYPIIDDDFVAEKLGAVGIAVPEAPMAARLAGNALTAGMAAHYLETAAELARQSGLDHGLFRLPASAWEEKAAQLLAPFGDGEATVPMPNPPQAPDPLNSPTIAKRHRQLCPSPRQSSTEKPGSAFRARPTTLSPSG
ncbi:hypothetical protein [Devosia sp. CAU 1758]